MKHIRYVLYILFSVFLIYKIRQNWDPYEFKPVDKMYIITLERTKKRAYPLMSQLQQLGYNPELFYGVDGKKVSQKKHSFKYLKPGEIGCWLSHYHLLQRVAALPDDTRVVIFEDDANVLFPLRFPKFDYDVFYLGYIENNHSIFIDFLITMIRSPIERSYGHGGLHAYSVTPQGARKIIRAFQQESQEVVCQPIDIAYIHVFKKFAHDIRVYTSYPTQIQQRGDPSVIHDLY